MNYTIYDTTSPTPSTQEVNKVWGVILFGDKITITSNFALAIIVYGDFPHHDAEQKFKVYPLFRHIIEQATEWKQFEGWINLIKFLRKKKNRNANEMKTLLGMEVWLRKHEKWFMGTLEENLRRYHYTEIIPLTLRYEDGLDPDVNVTLPWKTMDNDSGPAFEHYIKTIFNSLIQPDNLFVLDERIEPFIEQYNLGEYKEGELNKDEKVVVFLDKFLTIPICYSLKSNEIIMVRNELTKHFRPFHESIRNLASNLLKSKSEESSNDILKDAIKEIMTKCDGLQNKIDTNAFVVKANNQQVEIPRVDVYLALASNKGILTLLKCLGMLQEEPYLLAIDIVGKQSNLDRLRPFIYINPHKK